MKTNSKIFKTAILSVLSLTAGCETYYKLPSEPTAKVRFSAAGSRQVVLINSFESEKCEFGATGGVLGVIGGIPSDPLNVVPPYVRENGNTLGMIGYNLNAPIKPIERLIPSDKPFLFSIWRMMSANSFGVKTCTVSMMFNPQYNKQYEVEYGETQDTCGAKVYLLSMQDGILKKEIEPSAIRNPTQCGVRK